MAEQPKSSIFDDEDDEQEYAPVELGQETTEASHQEHNPYAEQEHQEQEAYNPYATDNTAQEEQQAYNPYAEDESEVQPANPFDEQPIEQPEEPVQEEEKKEESSEAQSSSNQITTPSPALSEAEQAKFKLLQELQSFTEGEEAQLGATEEEDRIAKYFSVVNPMKVAGTIKYTIQGQDSQGAFEVVRRYNEFFALRAALVERWPGCYIPCIPEKKTLAVDTSSSNMSDWSMGSTKEGPFVEMRRALFERFIRELAKYEYLVESKEFQIFAHEAGEVDKRLAQLPKQQPMQILEKYRLNFKIDEDQDATEIAKYREKINMFILFLKKADGMMEKAKENLKEMVIHHDKLKDNYLRMYYAFMKYEDIAVDYFSDCDVNKRSMTHPGVGDVKQKVVDAYNQVNNPFRDAYIWIKGEQLDMKGMLDALIGREGVMRQQINSENQRRSDQTELDKLDMGKSSFKNFFKSKDSKEKSKQDLRAKIDSANHMIDDYRKLVNFVTIMHGALVIDRFKSTKVTQYKRMLRQFSVREITNCHLSANLCHGILQLDELKQ